MRFQKKINIVLAPFMSEVDGNEVDFELTRLLVRLHESLIKLHKVPVKAHHAPSIIHRVTLRSRSRPLQQQHTKHCLRTTAVEK